MSRSNLDGNLLGALSIVGLGALAVVFQAFPALGTRATLYLGSIGVGDIYRIVSCHFDHWSWNHLFWSGGTFAVAGLVAWRASNTRSVLGLVGTSCLFVGVGVLVSRPDLSAYNGLSGIDCSLFAFVAMILMERAWRENDRRTLAFGLFALIGLSLKIAVEMQGHRFFVSTPGMVVVPEAHLLGMVAGLLFGAWHLFKRRPGAGAANIQSTPDAC